MGTAKKPARRAASKPEPRVKKVTLAIPELDGQTLRRRTLQLELLLQAAGNLNRKLQVNVVLRELVKTAMKLVAAAAGKAGLMIDGKMVFNEYHRGRVILKIDYSFPKNVGVAGHVMVTGKPYLTNQAHKDRYVISDIQQKLGFYKLLNVPILTRTGKLLGCMEMHNPASGRRFDHEDTRILTGLADLAAVALENAQLLEQKTRAQEALRRSRQMLELVLNTIPARVFWKDRHSVFQGGNLLFAQDAGLSSAQEILGKKDDELRWRDQAGIYQADDQYVMQTGKPKLQYEEPQTTPDGRTLVLSTSKVPLRNLQGRIVGVLGTYEDITKRKRAEEQLKALNANLEQRVAERTAEAEQRAQQLRALAGELTQAEHHERRRVASILHEHFQQLLAAGRMNLRVLLDQQGLDSSELQGLRTIDHILEQAIEETRSLTVELCPPVLYELGLAPALDWLGRQFERKHGLRVLVHADPQAEPAPDDMRVFLFEAVQELLFNIVKYAKVCRARVNMTLLGKDRLKITVSDRGVGFDPQATTADGLRGQFGLFSIRERIALMGGSLRIHSQPGQGASLTLVAPRQAAIQAAPARVAKRPEPIRVARPAQLVPRLGRKIRVLLADDHIIVRQGLTSLLEQEADIEMIDLVASDGLMALELARRTHPDVIIMDVAMPVLNGIEATKRIKAELPDVRVIGLSMHHEQEMAQAMLQAGAESYITKGGPSDRLLAAIRACPASKT